jgi:hypothetical protein
METPGGFDGERVGMLLYLLIDLADI